jgi:hypothetical protein
MVDDGPQVRQGGREALDHRQMVLSHEQFEGQVAGEDGASRRDDPVLVEVSRGGGLEPKTSTSFSSPLNVSMRRSSLGS